MEKEMGEHMDMDLAGDTRETIVIVGGGICGLATALALHRKGIRSLVLERSKTLQATGVIVVHPNGWRALDQLGVASYLRQTAIPILSGQFISLDKNKMEEMGLGKEELRCLKRTDLIKILADNLPPNTVRFGCNVLSMEMDPITSSPVIQLEDGTSLNAKVVIGCDGVNSKIAKLIGVQAPTIFNVLTIRGITNYPSGHKFGNEFKMMKKDDVTFGVTPMTTNRIFWFISTKYISESDSKISKNHKLIVNVASELVKDFPSSIKEMVKNCSPEYSHFSERLKFQTPWGILRTQYRVGRVTVAGDAMHAMTPYIAQGGSASLEDAVVLARCLGRKTVVGGPSGGESKVMVEEAFDEYLKERKPRVMKLSLQSYLLAKMEETSSKFIKFLCIVFMVVLFPDSLSHTHYDCGSL